MSTKELTTLIQAATCHHGLFAGYLSKWRGSLPSTCKLCGEAEETSLHLWGECHALELERFQLSSREGGGRDSGEDEESKRLTCCSEITDTASSVNTFSNHLLTYPFGDSFNYSVKLGPKYIPIRDMTYSVIYLSIIDCI